MGVCPDVANPQRQAGLYPFQRLALTLLITTQHQSRNRSVKPVFGNASGPSDLADVALYRVVRRDAGYHGARRSGTETGNDHIEPGNAVRHSL